ncbi:MAG: hypothetical protein FWH37_09085 [Candidatus Bathyarchaeota archaeon]|nr:hypothetical protein [Candidatus Termiticorpusculum sp.]
MSDEKLSKKTLLKIAILTGIGLGGAYVTLKYYRKIRPKTPPDQQEKPLPTREKPLPELNRGS